MAYAAARVAPARLIRDQHERFQRRDFPRTRAVIGPDLDGEATVAQHPSVETRAFDDPAAARHYAHPGTDDVVETSRLPPRAGHLQHASPRGPAEPRGCGAFALATPHYPVGTALEPRALREINGRSSPD